MFEKWSSVSERSGKDGGLISQVNAFLQCYPGNMWSNGEWEIRRWWSDIPGQCVFAVLSRQHVVERWVRDQEKTVVWYSWSMRFCGVIRQHVFFFNWWFLCLMAYQVFLCYLMPSHSPRRTVVVLFNHSWEDKGVHTFPKGICPKVNVIARLEYELAYYDSAVHRLNHYTRGHPATCGQTLSRPKL